MRIVGITIPENKRLKIALTVLYGIGRERALLILKEAGVDNVRIERGVKKIAEAQRRRADPGLTRLRRCAMPVSCYGCG